MTHNKEYENLVIMGFKRIRLGMDLQINSCTSQLYTQWLTLGTGPVKEDGFDMVMHADMKGETLQKKRKKEQSSLMGMEKLNSSFEGGLYTNYLTLGIGSWREVGLNIVMAANKEGETHEDCEDVHGQEESKFKCNVPEDIMKIIFSKVPLHTLLQVDSISTSWHAFVSSSDCFQSLWEQNNMQMWVVMDNYDSLSNASNGLALFDISRGLWLKKLFNDEWKFHTSEWYLRSGDGGLLVYSCKRNGKLKVVNPLTMQSHCLEDAILPGARPLSFYIKSHHDDVGIHLKFDSMEMAYQVIVIGNLGQRLHVLTYRSAERRWERKIPQLHGVNRFGRNKHFPIFFLQDHQIYCFSTDGRKLVVCHDTNRINHYDIGQNHVPHLALGVVMYKGRIMMICKGIPNKIITYELDGVNLSWRLIFEAEEIGNNLHYPVICCGGDCIWVMYQSNVNVWQMISIDVDAGKLNMQPGPSPLNFTLRNFLSMPLRFRAFKL